MTDIGFSSLCYREGEELQVTSFPNLVLFKNGSEVNRIIGARDKRALIAFILEHSQ